MTSQRQVLTWPMSRHSLNERACRRFRRASTSSSRHSPPRLRHSAATDTAQPTTSQNRQRDKADDPAGCAAQSVFVLLHPLQDRDCLLHGATRLRDRPFFLGSLRFSRARGLAQHADGSVSQIFRDRTQPCDQVVKIGHGARGYAPFLLARRRSSRPRWRLRMRMFFGVTSTSSSSAIHSMADSRE